MNNVIDIKIPAPNIQTIKVRVNGTSPLLFHRWSDKAKQQIRDKQQKKANKGRGIRKPAEEFLESFYVDTDNNIAFPALCLKQAIVAAARSIPDLAMTQLRGSVFVKGDLDGLIPVLIGKKKVKKNKMIDYKKNGIKNDLIGYMKNYKDQVECLESMVRVGKGSADLRYRGHIKNWNMTFNIKINADVISPEQVMNLLQIAGFSSGLGEWRAERSGNYGSFEVAS